MFDKTKPLFGFGDHDPVLGLVALKDLYNGETMAR